MNQYRLAWSIVFRTYQTFSGPLPWKTGACLSRPVQQHSGHSLTSACRGHPSMWRRLCSPPLSIQPLPKSRLSNLTFLREPRVTFRWLRKSPLFLFASGHVIDATWLTLATAVLFYCGLILSGMHNELATSVGLFEDPSLPNKVVPPETDIIEESIVVCRGKWGSLARVWQE